jgi:hypothetical protein
VMHFTQAVQTLLFTNTAPVLLLTDRALTGHD